MSHTRLVDQARSPAMSFKQKLKNMVGHEEFTKANIWKALLAEFIGTGLLVLVGCGACTPWDKKVAPSVVQIGLAFGLIVGTMVQCIGHISGGHINPAVTMGCIVTGHTSILRGILYVLVQCIGATAGAAILLGCTPSHLNSQIGVTALGTNMNGAMGLLVECCITFVLVFTVLAVIDPNRQDLKGSAPLAIGLSITACHMWAVKFTGASMNTARSFGPALILNNWDHQWIYWVGPLLGGFVAGLLYKLIFEAPEPDEGKGLPEPLKVDDEEDSEKNAGADKNEKKPQPPPKV